MPPELPGVVEDSDSVVQTAELSTAEYLSRISLTLRGIRPTVEELELVETSPDALEGLVDAYLASPEFGEVIKDMHAEMLQVRADVVDPLPALGPLEGMKLSKLFAAHSEAPLELVKYIVENDRPYSEIVTADYMLTNELLSVMYGTAYDPSGPDWQVSHWSDYRPHAGLLSSSELWRRHESAGSNFHRLRANFVADTFLCADFANRDIAGVGEVNISDEFEVAEVTRTDPGCIGCHQALDPLASFFWGFLGRFKGSYTAKAYREGCGYDWGPNPPTDDVLPAQCCYPIRLWAADAQQDWRAWDLREPGYYGQPAHDLTDLGRMIADDQRFSQCMARQFYGYFTQRDKEDVPLELAFEFQDVLESTNFDAKALAKAIVLHDSFRTHRALVEEPTEHVVELQTIRPEQYARTIEELTGFRWLVWADLAGCERGNGDAYGSRCWGEVDMMRSDVFGYRAMFGGITGYFITLPTYTPTPTKELVAQRFAFEAAGYVVDRDLALPDAGARRLLKSVEATTVDEASIRQQIASLHGPILGTFVSAESDEVTALYTMFADKLGRDASVEGAWKLVLSAMFLDPEMMFY